MTKQEKQTLLPSSVRLAIGTAIIVLFLSLLAAEIYTGFRGYDDMAKSLGSKTAALIAAGKTAGLIAAMIVLLQFSLTAKFKILDKVFGFDRLILFHMIMGTTAACLIVLHPLLMYGSKVYQLGELRFALWPQMLGATALSLLWIIAITSLWRKFLQLRFETRLMIHQLTFITAFIVAVHSVTLGSDLVPGWPLVLWLIVIGAYILTLIWVKLIKPGILRKNFFTVTEVTQVSHNAFNLRLMPAGGKLFNYLPGQFAFLTLYRKNMPAEEHPFTISSAPTQEDFITFTIKQSGDYTSTINLTKPGDIASIDGPYGQFSHLRFGKFDHLVMIAGGIGITPILSCLRYMAATNFDKPVTLIWSNRIKDDIVFADELAQIQTSLHKMKIHHVLSRQPDFEGLKGHLDEQVLRKLLPENCGNCDVMLCGPAPMMKSVSTSLRNIGFSRRQIHSEKFMLAD